MIEEIIRIDIDPTAETGEFNLVDKIDVGQDMNKILGKKILEVT